MDEPRPLRGATRPYVPAGTAIEICVSTSAFPWAGITFLSALRKRVRRFQILRLDYCVYLYRSYPAERAEPRVGNLALSDKRLTRRFETGRDDCDSVAVIELTDILLFFNSGVSDISSRGKAIDALLSLNQESVATPTVQLAENIG